MNPWTDRLTTIFTTLPPLSQWVTLLVGLLLLLSWLYLLSAIRSLKRVVDDFSADVRRSAGRLGSTLLQQQGELIRRMGRAVTHLERIEQKLGSIAPPDMHVSSITAQNLVVRPSVGGDSSRHGENNRPEP
jgi:hypothetical protein